MDLTLSSLLQMARLSVQSPQDGARAVLNLNLPLQARWIALILIAVASTVITHLSFSLIAPEDLAMLGVMATSPFRMALVQVVLLAMMVQVIHKVGGWSGGHGRFADALVLVAWLQFILLLVQGVQIVCQVILPPLAEVLGLLGLGLFFWLLTGFVAELHGFASRLRVAAGILATLVGLTFVTTALLMLVIGTGV